MLNNRQQSFQNVSHYPSNHLQLQGERVLIPVTYKQVWNDGFGARGWKVDATIGDPQIIASNRETGQRINTSVFIHDILDHFLSGFGVSGHRSEAMALIQLAKRTGADPGLDYKQIIQEDLFNGRVNGESFKSFLPKALSTLLPAGNSMPDKEIVAYLKKKSGEEHLLEILIEHFFTIGKAGENHAIKSWKKLGLNPEKQTEIALALQDLLTTIDRSAEEKVIKELKGVIIITNNHVAFEASENNDIDSIKHKQVTIKA